MKRTTLFILVLLSSLLLSLPWYEKFSGIIIFIAFIPLLFLEDSISKSKKSNKRTTLIAYLSLTFCLWNILTTYWIYNAAFIAVVSAVLVNTFLFTFVFLLFHSTKKHLGNKVGYFSFIIYWLAFEYFYLNAEISWPWLNLGNALAKDIKLIQWYEYTGSLGGSLWILLLNLFLFFILKSILSKKKGLTLSNSIVYAAILLLPIVISLSIFRNYIEKGANYTIAVLQPNIDPYNDKFSDMSHFDQLKVIINLADSIVDKNTEYIVGPETSLDNSIWINKLDKNYTINFIKDFVRANPKVSFVTGIDCFKEYFPGEKLSKTARYWKEEDIYYDSYNSAIQIDSSKNMPVYHKSKLVIGVEKMPFPGLLSFLEKFILNLGGTTGSRGTQNYRGTFKNNTDSIRIAPVICYESVYGEFVTGYIKNGASLIFVLTNDGWWGNTPGYKQHLSYSLLRAIETRRSIARSANTGISAFINQRGEILNKTKWWVSTAIKNNLRANKELTFYVLYGDYIGRISVFLSILILLYTLVQFLIHKNTLPKFS